MSGIDIIRYEVLEDAAEENQRLIERVFAELEQQGSAGVRYAAFRLADGVGFVHLVGSRQAPELTRLSAFEDFQRGIGHRLLAPPVRVSASQIGYHGFLGAGGR